MDLVRTDRKWPGTERQVGESLVQRRFLNVYRGRIHSETQGRRKGDKGGGQRATEQQQVGG